MNFSHLNLPGTNGLAKDLIMDLLSMKQKEQKYKENYAKCNLDDILVVSKLHNEDFSVED